MADVKKITWSKDRRYFFVKSEKTMYTEEQVDYTKDFARNFYYVLHWEIPRSFIVEDDIQVRDRYFPRIVHRFYTYKGKDVKIEDGMVHLSEYIEYPFCILPGHWNHVEAIPIMKYTKERRLTIVVDAATGYIVGIVPKPEQYIKAIKNFVFNSENKSYVNALTGQSFTVHTRVKDFDSDYVYDLDL